MRNLKIGWIALGWFIAVCVTSLILLALAAAGLAGDTAPEESMAVSLAIVAGFFLGGFFAAGRIGAAPILHGVLIGLFSLVAWFIVNLLLGEPTGVTTWRSLQADSLFSILGLQIASAVIGARVAVRWLRTRA